jgi:hypothetical protein
LSSVARVDRRLLGKPRLLQEKLVSRNKQISVRQRETDLRFFCIYAAVGIYGYTFFGSKISPIFFVLQVKQRHGTVNRNA